MGYACLPRIWLPVQVQKRSWWQQSRSGATALLLLLLLRRRPRPRPRQRHSALAALLLLVLRLQSLTSCSSEDSACTSPLSTRSSAVEDGWRRGGW